MREEKVSYPHNLNFLELASITGTALGLPAMVIGGRLAREYGVGSALVAICIGNLILWMIGLGIISMMQGREHAIQNVKDYLGKYTGIFAALVVACSFLSWYTVQIEGVLETINLTFQSSNQWGVGIILGLSIALFSMGGMPLIKKFCMIGLPLLLLFAIYSIITSTKSISFHGTWGMSFSAILTVISMWLPCTVNLPTFFRYSLSKSDSILGLSLTTLLHIFFQTFTILIDVNTPATFLNHYLINSTFSFHTFLAFSFGLLAFACINLVNIQYGSASWETLFPEHRGYKEYVILGIAGTLGYVFLQAFSFSLQLTFPIEFLEGLAASFIASLGIVLLLSFFKTIAIKHKRKSFDKSRGTLCWLIGCVAAIFVQIHSPSNSSASLIAGIVGSFLAFLFMIFIEEAIWSLKTIRQ